MKAKPLIGFALLGLLIAIASLIMAFQMPIVAQNQVQNALTDLGFHTTQSAPPYAKLGALEYKDIELDQHKFSTIKSLKIEYNWLTLFLFGQITNITIEGLNLTGEMDDKKNLTIAGWTGKIEDRLLSDLLRIKTITIKNAQASILNETSGAISLQYNGEIIRQNKNKLTIQGKLKTTQKQMRYTADITGQINKDLTWHSDIEIKDLHLKTPDIKLARAGGQLKLTKDLAQEAKQEAKLSGEIHAGQITLAGLPWTKTAITLQGSLTRPGILLGAKAVGHEEIELGLALDNAYAPEKASGYIYSKTLGTFFNYLNQNDTLPIQIETLTPLYDLKDIEITFEKQNNDIEFNIKNKEISFEGFIQKDSKENSPTPVLGAVLKSQKAGIINITDPDFFKELEGSDAHKNEIKIALKNFHYEQLIIRAKALNEGQFKFKADLKGRNPDTNQSTTLNLTFKSKLEPLAKMLLENP